MLEFANIVNPDQFTPLAVYDTGAEFSGLDENRWQLNYITKMPQGLSLSPPYFFQGRGWMSLDFWKKLA